MQPWTAFLLGLVGSLHCAGMCGPLALALSAKNRSSDAFLARPLAYHLGRLLTYSALGLVFGLLGQTLALAGLQRWVSIAAGSAILFAVLASSRIRVGMPAVRFVGFLKSRLGNLLQRKSVGSQFLFGLLNGLLPCGLVYAACAAVTTAAGVWTAVLAMLAFGTGTLPMMLGISLAAQPLQLALRFKLQRLIPLSLAVVGMLLILRGLSLGIPYVSPDLSVHPAPACH